MSLLFKPSSIPCYYCFWTCASLVLILIFTSSARSLAVLLLANLHLVLRLSHGPRNAHVVVVIIRVCKEAGVVFIYLLTL